MRPIAAILLAAAALPAAEEARLQLTTVPLADSSGQAFCRLRDGGGSIPFANAAGSLRIRREGDLMRFDSDGDGDIDDQDAPAAKGGMMRRDGGTVQVAVLRGGVAGTAAIRVAWSDARYVMIESASALQMTVDGTAMQFLDGDVDGRVGGAGDKIRVGTGTVLPMSRLVEVNGRLLEVAVSDDATAALVSAWKGTPSRISLAFVPPAPPRPGLTLDGASLTLVHEQGLMAIELQAGRELLAPPGRYRITADQLVLRTRDDSIFLHGGGDRSVELGPEPLRLQRSVPRRLVFAAGIDPAGIASVTAMSLEDGLGGRWRADAEGSTTQLLLRGNGSDRPVQKLEYG